MTISINFPKHTFTCVNNICFQSLDCEWEFENIFLIIVYF